MKLMYIYLVIYSGLEGSQQNLSFQDSYNKKCLSSCLTFHNVNNFSSLVSILYIPCLHSLLSILRFKKYSRCLFIFTGSINKFLITGVIGWEGVGGDKSYG